MQSLEELIQTYPMMDNEKTSITRYENKFNDWLYGLGEQILSERLQCK